jgi:hypothetical protein
MPFNQELDDEGQVPIRRFYLWGIFWSEQDVCVRQLHSLPWLHLLGQVNLSLKLLSLSLGAAHHCQSWLSDDLLGVAQVPLVCLLSSCDLGKFYTPPDHVRLCDGFHTTSQHQWSTGMTFSPTDKAASGSHKWEY